MDMEEGEDEDEEKSADGVFLEAVKKMYEYM